MDFDRKQEPSYTKTSKGSNVDHEVESLFKKFNKDGPMFDFQKFEHILADINSDNDKDYMDKVRDVFMEQLSKVKTLSRKYSKKIIEKLGSKNVTDTQVLEYVTKQGEKKKLPSYMVEAIIREVSQTLSERPQRTPYFRFQPYKNSKVGSTLGYLGQDKYTHFKAQQHDAVKHMETTQTRDASIHSNVITQSLHYQDCSVEALTGIFEPQKNDKYSHIHPVIAALYIPKIRILEELTLFSSIANVVLSRSNNEPIATRPDYELFYNMVHDPNESVCDHKDPLVDLAKRSDIQLALWKTVLALRAGRYYDAAGNFLLDQLNNCKYYRYDAVDIAYSGNESDIVRRLLMTFSLRPIKVRTLPALPGVASNLSLNTPFVNVELQQGKIDTLPIANIRLGLYNENTPAPRVEDVLRNTELYWDHLSGQIIPRLTQIVTTNELLIINIHRRQLTVPLMRFNGPFTFRDLPTTPKDVFSLNMNEVVVDRNITINNEQYELRSVVCTKVTQYTDNNGVERQIPQGSQTIIFPTENNLDLPANNFIVYDPANVGRRLGQTGELSLNQPVVFNSFGGASAEDDLSLRISTKGVLVVYTKKPSTNI